MFLRARWGAVDLACRDGETSQRRAYKDGLRVRVVEGSSPNLSL